MSGSLLLDLPPNTQISIDGHAQAYLTNDRFEGIKQVPRGWHCIAWNVREPDFAGDNVSQLAFSGQGAVKHVLLRWFEQANVITRTLDRASEQLIDPAVSRRTHRRLQRRIEADSLPTPQASRDYPKGVKDRLLPYPSECQAKWQRATRNLSLNSGRLGRAVVAKVVGMATDTGDSAVDSLTTGPATSEGKQDDTAALSSEGSSGRAEQGKRIWGKSRPEEVPRFEEISDDEERASEHLTEPQKRKRPQEDVVREADEDDGLLHFTLIDLRRSWPADSLGPEITRWSRDKSWLLGHTMTRALIGVTDIDQADLPLHCSILCELELAFILFVQCGNAYCWEQWKCIVTLFCRSSSYLGAGTEWQPHPSVDDISGQDVNGSAEAHAAFLQVLNAQMELLEDDFWSTQSTPSDEKALLEDLDTLRANIGRSLAWRAAAARSNTATTPDPAVNNLIGAWRSFSHLTLAKFGWQLDRRLDEEAEVEQDLEAEEGDDAPVVVEM